MSKKISDPTKAANRRTDDFRKSDHRLFKSEMRRLDEKQATSDRILILEIAHIKELMEENSKRIDANRAGDNQAIMVANERSINQAAVQAKQVENLARLIADQLDATKKEISVSIKALENNQSQTQGKSSIWKEPILVAFVSAALTLLIAVIIYFVKK